MTCVPVQSSLSAQGLQLNSVVLLSATAAVPSISSRQCFTQPDGYCTGEAHFIVNEVLGAVPQ